MVGGRGALLSALQCLAQDAIVPLQQIFSICATKIESLHDDGGLHRPGFVQQLRGACGACAGSLRNNTFGTIYKLRVRGCNVRHQVAVHVAEPDHEAGGQHIQHQLGGGAGLHARTAGDALRAGRGG